MNMARKLTLLLSAVALLAFAIPPFARADSITSKAGVLAPINSAVTATSTNLTITNTPFGTIACTKVTLDLDLSKNNGSEVGAVGTAGSADHCAATDKLVAIDSPSLTTLTAGAASGTTFVTIDFTATIGPAKCAYQTDSPTSVPFTYAKGSDTISIAGTLEDPARAACLTPTIEGDFTLTLGGTPVILD
jgi:hypothetical protein